MDLSNLQIMKTKFLLIAMVLFIVASCSKDDTVATATPCPVIKTSEELLCAHTWRIDEFRQRYNSGASNGVDIYYKLGGAANTANYDSDSIKFNINNTGVYYSLGSQYTTTWNFVDAAKSKMTLTINYPTPFVDNLETISLSENYFRYSQYFSFNAVDYLGAGTRTPN